MSTSLPKIELVSKDKQKKLIISADGPTSATILLPYVDRFQFITDNDAKTKIANMIGEGFFLNKPIIEAPRNNEKQFSGDIVIAEDREIFNDCYYEGGFESKATMIYQFSTQEDFSDIVLELTRRSLFYVQGDSPEDPLPGIDGGGNGYYILRLPRELYVNKGIIGSSDNREIEYYVRAKLILGNICSQWSDPVKCTFKSNAYKTPIIKSANMLVDPAFANDPEGKFEDIKTKLSRNIEIALEPYGVEYGTLSAPKEVIIRIEGTGRVSTYRHEFTVPYTTEKLIVLPNWPEDISNYNIDSCTNFMSSDNSTPLTYNISVQYKTIDQDGMEVRSGFSNPKSIEVPKARFLIHNFHLVQDMVNGTIPTSPTIGVDKLVVDYNLIDLMTNGNPYINNNPNTPDTRYLQYTITGERNVQKDHEARTSAIFVVDKQIKIPIYLLDQDFYKGCLITLPNNTLNTSTPYIFRCSVELKTGTPGNDIAIDKYIVQAQPVERRVTTNSITITINTDGLANPIREYPIKSSGKKYSGYFGEVQNVPDSPHAFMPNVRYRGDVGINITYRQFDEVVYKNELYLCIANSNVPVVLDTLDGFETNANFKQVSGDKNYDTYKTYYKSGLPSYKWLADQIGLPLGMPYSRETSGLMSPDYASSPLMNQEGSWIKVHNYAKQILYIAKKPIASSIPYRELKRRFLTGDYTRTIRIGLDYYSVRLLEVGPNDVIGESIVTADNINTSKNLQNEIELFEALFDSKKLNGYVLEDLGITNTDNKTFIGTGFVNLTVERNEQDGMDYVIANTTHMNPSMYDEASPTYYYRPVLELIRDDKLPFRKPKTLPGNSYLKYDKWADTGYYGEVTSDSLFNSSEIKDLFKINGLTNLKNSLKFHKFYYHGLVLYIPSTPIGILPREDSKSLNTADIVYGTDKNYSVLFRGTKWCMMLPNFSNTYYLNYTPRGDVNVLSKTEDNSIISDLVRRISNKFDHLANDEFNIRFANKWPEGPLEDFTDVKNFYIKDITLDNVNTEDPNTPPIHQLADLGRVVDIDGVLTVLAKNSNNPAYDEALNIWPVFATQVLDPKTDMSYKKLENGKKKVETVEVEVEVYTVEPKTVTVEYPVKEIRQETVTEEIEVEKKVPTGKKLYRQVAKTDKDTFCLALFYAKKSDDCNIPFKLYDQRMLNVVNYKDGLGLGFSEKYPDINTYILRSVMVNSSRTLLRDPLLINKSFVDTRDVRTYLRQCFDSKYTIGSLKNYAYDKVLTSTDKKLPLGMMYGNLSSMYTYFLMPTWYDIYKNGESKMNKDPMITVEAGNYSNSWTTMPDKDNVIHTIPCLSMYLPYEEYTAFCKENILEPFIDYIATKEFLEITPETEEKIKNTIRTEYVFGILGYDSETLHILPESGIIYGDSFQPNITQTDHMDRYFQNPDHKFLDLFNPESDYKIIKETITKTYTKNVEVYVMKTENITVFEEKKVKKTIKIPYISYE